MNKKLKKLKIFKIIESHCGTRVAKKAIRDLRSSQGSTRVTAIYRAEEAVAEINELRLYTARIVDANLSGSVLKITRGKRSKTNN